MCFQRKSRAEKTKALVRKIVIFILAKETGIGRRGINNETVIKEEVLIKIVRILVFSLEVSVALNPGSDCSTLGKFMERIEIDSDGNISI
ncbi:MAG: hypothetical protein WC242_04265 [Candidatus Paceibacterota bacterium]|jgi:hypothetical protein